MQITLSLLPTYQNLYTLSGLPVGSDIAINNCSSGTVNVIKAVSQPNESEFGRAITTVETIVQEGTVGEVIWIRCSSSGPVVISDSSSATVIATSTSFPNELTTELPFTTNPQETLTVTSLTQSAAATIRGNLYGGYSERTIVDAGVAYLLLTAGSKEVFIEDISPVVDFSGLTNGRMTCKVELFLQNSSINNYTTSGGTVGPAGRNQNGNFINTFPQATITRDPTVSVLTGVSDFTIYHTSQNQTGSGSNVVTSATLGAFFVHEGYLIIPAGTTVLVRTQLTGTPTGNSYLRTDYTFIER
jgi:hypothetical protein